MLEIVYCPSFSRLYQEPELCRQLASRQYSYHAIASSDSAVSRSSRFVHQILCNCSVADSRYLSLTSPHRSSRLCNWSTKPDNPCLGRGAAEVSSYGWFINLGNYNQNNLASTSPSGFEHRKIGLRFASS